MQAPADELQRTPDDRGTRSATLRLVGRQVRPRPSSAVISPTRLRRNLVAADAVAIVAGFAACFLVAGDLRPDASTSMLAAVSLVSGLAWLGAIAAMKLYRARAIERPLEELRRILIAGVIGASAFVLSAFMFDTMLVPRAWLLLLFVTVSAAVSIDRRAARNVFDRLRATGRINRRIAIVGTDPHALELFASFAGNPELGYEVVGLIGTSNVARRGAPNVLGTLDDTAEILRDNECVGAVISLPSATSTQVNRLTRELTDGGFHVALSTSLRDIDVARIRPQGLDGQSLLYVEPTIRSGWRNVAKRAFDVVIATVGLVLTLPFVAIAAVLIKLESDGPVLFRQERLGRDGATFEMLKLRTMYRDAEQRKAELASRNESDGPLFKIKDDPRITRVGRILRKASIDEFPQFWNVLRGEMSIVGPRPALATEAEEWDDELRDRLRVLPGITGLWQVSGRSESSFEAYRRLDLYYVDNWSLVHDMQIVLKTFGAVVFGRGAS